MACCGAPGNDEPRERRPTEMAAGAPALVVSSTRPGAIGTRHGDACSRYVVLSARFRAGVYRPGANGAVTGNPPVDRALRPLGAAQQKPLVLGPISWSEPGAAPSGKERSAGAEDASENREVVDDDADIPDHGVVVRGTRVVVLVPLLTVVVPTAAVVTLTTARKRGARGGDCTDAENPASHKRNTSNFGPHGSMFLSMDDNRTQHAT